MLSNFDLHQRVMDHVSELLTGQNWIVESIKMGKDDYLQINRPESYKTYRIKVKALSQEAPVPFHTRSPDSIRADFLVICRNMTTDTPEVFTSTMKEVSEIIHYDGDSYWLETKDYEKFEKGFDITKLK